ncbi:MAG: hypothetical protein HKN09_03350 [Saprospiraceae bacterium]|nr:hypothetical protein [Saprospiraceae bacterium]
MRKSFPVLLFIILRFCLNGQETDTNWYSTYEHNGISIQNSYPKGGPYPAPVTQHYNYSYLVFFSRIINATEKPFEIALNFSADSVAIPQSPDTFMKLFLPPDTMTLEKQDLFSYGITKLASLDKPTSFSRILKPEEECLFYVVAIFYQTTPSPWHNNRGGNRAELVLEGNDLYYNIPPQINSIYCGQINSPF